MRMSCKLVPFRMPPLRGASVLALLAALAMLAGFALHTVQKGRLAEEHMERDRLLLEIAEHIIHSQVRGGRYSPTALAGALEGLAASPQVAGVALAAADGTLLYASEPLPEAGDGVFSPKARRVSASLPVLGAHPGLGRNRGPRGMGPGGGGQGAPDWRPLPEGPHTLTLFLDTGPAREALAGIRLQAALLAVFLALFGGLTLWLRALLLRQRRLRDDLALAEERAAHQARLARLGAGLAHETKNPLSVVRGLAQAISETPKLDPAVRDRARNIVDESDRVVAQLNNFLLFARPMEARPGPLEPGPLVSGLAALLQAEAEGQGVALNVRIPGGVRVLADADLLRKALLNLLINGLRAMPGGGVLSVTLKAEADGLSLRVTDTGAGIAPEDLPRVGTPYFSRFPGGSGLGLAVVGEIARAHGWRLLFGAGPEGGAAVSLSGLQRVP